MLLFNIHRARKKYILGKDQYFCADRAASANVVFNLPPECGISSDHSCRDVLAKAKRVLPASQITVTQLI